MLRFNLRLRVGHRVHVAVVHRVVITRQQRAQIAQPQRHHIKHAAMGVLRHFLRHPRHHHAALHADLAIVGFDLAANQTHQGGLARAVAAHDAHALAGFDGEVDLFKQERAADAVVDVLELE